MRHSTHVEARFLVFVSADDCDAAQCVEGLGAGVTPYIAD
jgi:hypothetical protein